MNVTTLKYSPSYQVYDENSFTNIWVTGTSHSPVLEGDTDNTLHDDYNDPMSPVHIVHESYNDAIFTSVCTLQSDDRFIW